MINYPKLFSASATSFMSQGLGALSDCTKAIVTEKRNGSYELEMQYPISGLHFSEIAQRSIIVAKANYYDDPQPFRVYKITKPLNGICTIYAQHISYDLNGYEIAAGTTAANASAALAALDAAAGAFTVTGSLSGSAEFAVDVPSSVRSWFGGKKGSILDLYGGEWHFDGYTCRITTSRGTNRGVTIRYGKNLTSLTQEEKCANLYSAVRAYYKDTDDVVTQSALILTGAALVPGRILFVDASGDFDETPTVAQLNTYATNYISNNNLRTPEVNLTLDFVQMQDFDRVDLCDTVTVIFERLGVSATAKCIETKWNVLKDRYESITVGDAKSSMASTISNVAKSVADAAVNTAQTQLEKTIETATEKITGNLGGYVVIHDSDNDGQPDEILIMDTPDINTATKVWRWNKNGLGYSSTGYAGTYGTAITADGQIVADFITTGTMSADLIRGGTLILGGINNQDGVLQVTDASGNVVGSWDNTGITAIAGDIGDWTLANGQLSAVDGNYTNTLSASEIETMEHLQSSSKDFNRITRLKHGDLEFHSYNNTTSTDQTLLKIGPAYDSSNNPYGSFAVYKGIYYLPGAGGAVGYRYGGAEGAGTYGGWHYFGSTVRIASTLTVTGTKSRAVETEDYAERLLYAYETPSPMFGDVGEGVIGEDGLCYVWLDPIFAETIDKRQYQVFLQKYGEGDCYILERTQSRFIVSGTPGLSFGWEIKAKQIDYSQRRLDKHINGDWPLSIIGEESANYINELKEGRLPA